MIAHRQIVDVSGVECLETNVADHRRLVKRIEPFMAAASMPSVVLLRTIPLWLCGWSCMVAIIVVNSGNVA